jgi:hypothetical protein
MGLALFCGDRRTIAFYGHQPILSLTSLLSGCALHISDDFQQIRPRTMKVSCEQRFPSACVCVPRTNNGNFPARAVKMFTAARSFAVHWHCFYLFAALRCAWLYGILKPLSLCALVVGFALRLQCV